MLMQRAASERRQRSTFAAAPVPAPTVVAIYGDRLAQALTNGLQQNDDAAVAVTGAVGEEVGLARADFAQWLQSVRDRLRKSDHAAVALLMIGSDDQKPISDGGKTLEPGSPGWQEAYGNRVEAVASAFRDAHVPLIWVGLPPVRSPATSADFVRLNSIFRDHAARKGATYVDSWEAFSDESGRYNPVGPDVEGQSAKLRKADGFSFTGAGARKLASFVEGDIKRLKAANPAKAGQPAVADITIEKAQDFDSALDIDVNAQIRREAGLAPEGSATAGTPAATAHEAAPEKPVAGPIVPLTNPPLAPDGQLASASSPPTPGGAGIASQPHDETGGRTRRASARPGRRFHLAAAMRRLTLALAMTLLAATAQAEDFRTATPRPADQKSITGCLGTNKTPEERRRCIGLVSKPCQSTPDGQSTYGMQQCQSREYVVWDQILNRVYGSAAKAFDADGKAYLRDVQSTWIKFRDQSCQWPAKVYPGGTIAAPITGDCLIDETANRAITLMEISESLAQH